MRNGKSFEIQALPELVPPPGQRRCRIPLSISVVAPAVRLVVVDVLVRRGSGCGPAIDVNSYVFAVVAIEVETCQSFVWVRGAVPECPTSREEAIASRWRGLPTRIERHPLIVGYGGEVERMVSLNDCCDEEMGFISFHELVACPWKPSEDAKQLAPTIRWLTDVALSSLDRKESEAAKREQRKRDRAREIG